MSLTHRSGVRQEGAVVREPSVNTYRWGPVEPRVERQFLQVISETVPDNDGRRVGASQWIPDLEVVLTATDLTDVAPSRGWVYIIGIVHPFASFVRDDHRVVRTHEYAIRLKVERSIGLECDW